MAEKLYRIYCEICGYNRWSDGTDLDDMIPCKRSPIMTSIPRIDPITKKVTTKLPMPLPKLFKCPKCGRGVRPKQYPLPKAEDLFKNEQNENNNNSGSETGTR